MAFGGKEKKNPSSRYSRIEEPWLDDEDRPGGRETWNEIPADGYGVRDSLSRQASYGRPEGYYESGGYPENRYPEDRYPEDRYSEDRYPEDRYAGDGYRERGYGGDGGQSGGYAGDGQRGGGSSGDRYRDSGYDGAGFRDDGYRKSGEPEDGYPENRYDDAGWAGEDVQGYARSEGYGQEEGSGRGGYDGPAGRGKAPAAAHKSKTGFVVKLILLLIAAAVLAMVWRFSRLKHVSLTDILTNEGVSAPSGYREFVIYGVDSREGNLTKEAHSDTIIICSMNQSTKEIRMVSVYRDTYLDNTNGEYRKATECYYFGGPSRSVNMLNKNLDLDLHDYITVDFNAVVKAVDLIGGVDVDVTEDELPYINGYQTENAEVTGAQITPVESAGYQHLNGIQALAYCRIRYTEGSDYRRTERQRAVLSQIFEQAKSQGPVKMAQIIDSMLPYIATSFSSGDLLSLASAITGSSLLDSVGFPFELLAANIPAGDCVVPVNLAQNVSELHAYLYQQTGYTPSQTVQDISNEIANSTGIY